MSSPRAEANTIEAPLDVARIIVCSCFSLFLFLFLVSGSLIIHSFFAFDSMSLSFVLPNSNPSFVLMPIAHFNSFIVNLNCNFYKSKHVREIYNGLTSLIIS